MRDKGILSHPLETGFEKGAGLHFCTPAEETPGETGQQGQAVAKHHESVQDEKNKWNFHLTLHKQTKREATGWRSRERWKHPCWVQAHR
jgi:hypothetical protein